MVRAVRGGDASCEVVSLAFTSGVSQLGVVGSQRRSASVKVVGSKVMRWRCGQREKMCCGWCAWFSFCIVRPDASPRPSPTGEVTACIRTSYLCSCTGATRFIIRIRTRAVHIRTRRGITRGLGVTRAPLALVEDVVHAAGQADVLVTSRVALRPTMLYGLTSSFSDPVTG